ncbi:MAG: PBSX family phage terminase large subunit, partial [Clostridia bacterium]|nr:PBSX family phage terminase large subunit [Clostridia bacterium]
MVGKGYGKYWHFKGRYRVVKGSRASKKSKTTALWHVYMMMKHPGANTLVVRKTFRTLKDSCFTELKWAIHRLGVDHLWKIKESPLEMTYIPTGQKIYFRGLDDPMKVTSITVDNGHLCFLWIEEAFELDKEADFNTLDESIRGEVAEGLWKQITLTFNPWSGTHWLKKRFFDKPDPDVLAITTNYTCNEWLDDTDRRMFERMKEQNPRRYAVAGLGDWGVEENLIYSNWLIEAFDMAEIKKREDYWKYKHIFGLDYGYSNDPTAFVAAAVNTTDKVIYIYDEHYETRLLNSDIAKMLAEKGVAKERIRADAAEPKSNDELRRLGIHRILPATKGQDSIRAGIARLQEYRLIVHSTCKNTIAELSTYCWDKKSGTD